jgi:hypothetical protein
VRVGVTFCHMRVALGTRTGGTADLFALDG